MSAAYFNTVKEYMAKHPEQRAGQAAFNHLSDVDPTLARELWGTEFDPYYFDERLPAFYKEVERRW